MRGEMKIRQRYESIHNNHMKNEYQVDLYETIIHKYSPMKNISLQFLSLLWALSSFFICFKSCGRFFDLIFPFSSSCRLLTVDTQTVWVKQLSVAKIAEQFEPNGNEEDDESKRRKSTQNIKYCNECGYVYTLLLVIRMRSIDIFVVFDSHILVRCSPVHWNNTTLEICSYVRRGWRTTWYILDAQPKYFACISECPICCARFCVGAFFSFVAQPVS